MEYNDKRVPLLVWFVVIRSEHDAIVWVEVASDVCEVETTHLDETEESLGT